MSDFSGQVGFGHVYGMRKFKFEEGVLKSPVRDFDWSPGTNECGCEVMLGLYDIAKKYQGTKYTTDEILDYLADSGFGHKNKLDYDCTCGFYAYTDNTPNRFGGDIEGVIKGYGRVAIGEKGFRAEKAEVEAFLVLEPQPQPFRWMTKRMLGIPNGSFDWQSIVAIYAVAFVAMLAFSIAWWISLTATVAVYFAWLGGSIAYTAKGRGLEKIDTDLLTANYPKVKLYTDRNKMFTDYIKES